EAAASWLQGFYGTLGQVDQWSTVTSQYGDKTGHPTFGSPLLTGVYQDPSAPPTGADTSQIAAEADAAAAHLGITNDTNAQVVVATQSGTCPAGFAAACNPAADQLNCGWADETANGVPFVNLPYEPDAGFTCGGGYLLGTNDGFSLMGGALFADVVADPLLTGWFDQLDGGAGVGDKCMFADPVSGQLDINEVSLGAAGGGTTTPYAMMPIFSNSAQATYNNPGQSTIYGDGCVMAPGQDTVSVSDVASFYTTTGVQFTSTPLTTGVSSGGNGVTLQATGLPPGVGIDPSGSLTGSPTTPGTYRVVATGTDSTGATGLTAFTWQVFAGGALVSSASTSTKELCLDDALGSTANGNKVQIWKCNGNLSQIWNPHPDGTIHFALGGCLTDPGAGGPRTALVLDTCTAATDQKWTHKSSNEWVLAANRLCLTDPLSATKNGTPVQARTCTGGTSQTWSAPIPFKLHRGSPGHRFPGLS
ncbi:MAG TPA: ricin-type beta-trefoil lectin domain protein, partial [Streptosporangiaceae bacterium]|nr:ricin-type beta-trefoil lectin domain protein [Streptosporangiaceae bacterium]